MEQDNKHHVNSIVAFLKPCMNMETEQQQQEDGHPYEKRNPYSQKTSENLKSHPKSTSITIDPWLF
jgi:hypothetical protein